MLGITKPVAFGGGGLDFSYSVAAGEALGGMKAQGVGMALSVQSDMATPALAAYGSDMLRREYLAPALAGEVVVAIGVSEDGAGSDVASIRTRARSDGGDYVVDGGKMWITNGMEADWVCLLANTGEERAPQQVIDRAAAARDPGGPDRPGVTRRKIRNSACGAATPRSFSSMACGCRSATASARRAWASPTRCGSSRRRG
ncbi:acyl-CoA dehydrogenase family protein [Siccirubricoccus deserti]